MRNAFAIALVCGFVVLAMVSTAIAEVPQSINYQGRLTDDQGDPVTSTVAMTFAIYDAETDGDLKWTETHSSVSVVDGLFNVILGASTPPVPIEGTVFSGADRWLEIVVNGETIAQRTKLSSSPYAYHAQVSDGVVPDAITSDEILNGSIDFADIGQNGAAADQVMKWNGSAWAASDGEVGGGWVDDGADVRLATDNDSVGIGTSDPHVKLHVSNTGAAHQLMLESTGPGGGYWAIGQSDDGFSTGGGLLVFTPDVSGGAVHSVMALRNTGGVGIGTTNPVEELHVNGVIYSDLGGYRFPDGSVQTTAASTGGGGGWVDDGADVRQATLGDSVGIGTLDPHVMLHVLGTGTAHQLRLENTQLGGGYWDIAQSSNGFSSGGGLLVFTPDVSGGAVHSVMALRNTGGVGIGTTNPQGALDVNSTAGGLIVPRMTTAERDALTAINGTIIYNTTTDQFNFYENSSWVTK